ncbi:MAG: hypothetical protein JXR49_07830 [Acidobacteria bacterium]|nr:hypothetical protein [Acidobacteriota bacterium]
MEKMNRRAFCGTSLLALPLMSVFAEEKKNKACSNIPDPIMDVLSDEFAKTTFEGARNGFGAEHFRQYAGHVRILDAHLHAKGTNKKLDKKLDEDDYHLLDPDRTVRMTTEYWKKHGILINENKLREQISFDMDSYGLMKKAIKKRGGVRSLHESVAEALERKAGESETVVFRGGPIIRNGNVIFPDSGNPPHQIKPADFQLDFHSFIGVDLDCLCKAMAVEGSVLALMCVLGCVPCCAPSAVLLALETLMNSTGVCDPTLC